MRMKKSLKRMPTFFGLGVVLACCMVAQFAQAQDNPSRVYDEQLRVLLDKQSPTQRDLTVDAGGWYSFGFFDFDDASASKDRTLRQHQLRGWTSINKEDTHKFYFRGLLNYDDWNSDSNPSGRKDDYLEKLERAWYDLDVDKFLGWDADGPVSLDFKAGRAFQTIGSSFTMSIPLDLLSVTANVYDWQITSFVGRTIFRSSNIDRSSALVNRQDRVLWGTELVYEKFSNHRPFAYALINWDHTDPWTVSGSQSYKYDSQYVGIGSRGVLGSDDLRYNVELVREWGETYGNGAVSAQDDIRAYAFDAMLEYYLDHPTRPKLMAEYMFGTGDDDRGTSAVATAGGNTTGTMDRAFNAFGFRDTGIVLAPEVSNLHIYSGGASLFPWYDCPQFKDLETGAKMFFYSKHRDAGAISDTTATNGAGWVGYEWDLYVNWRVTSDLAGTVRYGMFHPGSAYDGGDKSSRNFLYSGLVVSF